MVLVAPVSQAADNTGATTSQPTKTYSLAQVKRHHTAGNCWSIVGKNVYSLSGWVGKHPGGKGVIVKMCGKNGTALFNSRHRSSRSAKAALSRYKIGTVR
jgi:cytochrome b involved in lipid metabolism